MGERILVSGDKIALGRSHIVFRATADHLVDVLSAANAGLDSRTEWAQSSSTVVGYLDVSDEWGADASGGAQGVPPADASHPRGVPSERGPVAQPLPSERVVPAQSASNRGAPAMPGGRPDRGTGRVRGVARNVSIRKPDFGPDVFSFRVDSFDSSGNRLDPVAVELQIYRGGQISDGEEVDVLGKWSHGTLQAHKITNVSTNAAVHGHSAVGLRVFVVSFLVVWLCFAGVVVYSIVNT